MSIVKLQSPIVVQGSGEKSSIGVLIFGLLAAAGIYLFIQHNKAKKQKEQAQHAN